MDKLRTTGPANPAKPPGAFPPPGAIETAPKSGKREAFGTDRLQLETPPAEPVMTVGGGDPNIRRVQECLSAHGFDPGPIDGLYGGRTERALLAFKQSRGLPATAVVDQEVWRHLQAGAQAPAPAPHAAPQAPAVGGGADAPTIRRVQEQLVAHGFNPGPIDGLYGGRTERALMAFKQSRGLPATATVDQEVWRQLRALAAPASAIAPPAAPAPVTLGQGGDFNVPVQAGVRAATQPTGRALPPAGAVTDPQEAYGVLIELNRQPSPYSLAETRRLCELARRYQDATLTRELRLPVDGGARTLTVKLGVGVDEAAARQAALTMYNASHPAHRDSITEVRYYTGPNAFDEFWEQEYQLTKDAVSEMTGGGSVISFYNVGDRDHPQRQELWDHEVGHLFAAEQRQEVRLVPTGWSEAVQRDAADRRNEFLTPYAEHTVTRAGVYHEDFAETYRGYMDALRDGDLDDFRKRYPHRTAVMDQLFS